MAAEPGFQIGDEFFPFPTFFTLGDAPLVQAVSGLEFEEFAAQIDDADGISSRALIGLVAVAVAHQNERWTRDRVVKFVESVNWDAFQNVEGDERPPAPATAEESPSPEPSEESTPTAEPPPEVPV